MVPNFYHNYVTNDQLIHTSKLWDGLIDVATGYRIKLTLIILGGGLNYHTLMENCDFSGTEPPLELRPVFTFKFVRCGIVEKKQSALSFFV